MPGIGVGISPMLRRFRASGYGAYTTAWYNEVLAQGGTATPTELTAFTTFENEIDLSEFDRLVITGLTDSIAAKISIVNPTSIMATWVNSPTFTSGLGVQGNGTNQYINTNFHLTNDSIKYTQDSCLFFEYQNIINSTAGSDGVFTTAGGDKYLLLYTNGGATAIRPAVNDMNIPATSTSTNALGMIGCIRTSSTNKNAFVNGVLSTNITETSTGLPNGNAFLLARNQDNVNAGEFQNRRIAAYGYGSGAIDQSNLYTAVQNLATTLGFNV